MEPVRETVYSVMYCDDLEGEAAYREAFEADAQRSRDNGPRRRFEVDGPVAPNPDYLLDELQARLAGGHRLPYLIVLDNQFRGQGPRGRPEKLAFATLRLLRRRFESWQRQLPPVVLSTTLDDATGVLDAYSWRQLGGAHVIDKGTTTYVEAVRVLWDVVDGRCWRPPEPPEPVVDLNAGSQLAILPPLEAGYPLERIVAWLVHRGMVRPRKKPPEETARYAIHNALSAMGKNESLLEHVRTINPAWTTLAAGSPKRDLALGAARAGHLFVRLSHQ